MAYWVFLIFFFCYAETHYIVQANLKLAGIVGKQSHIQP